MALLHDSRDIPALAGEARVEDYLALLKPRVMSLVVFTAFVGMLIAPGAINPVVAAIAIVCIAVGAGASGALNMWYDADIDAVMSRTMNRPIPAGRVSREEALVFGLVLAVFSVTLLGLAANWVAAAWLAFTIFFYVVIYTMWLKRLTPQNIVIGGAAGAFPPMIGWAAVTGTVTLESVVLFLIIFLWTPPHFWALALYKQGDYGAAGIPMMPNVAGETSTKRQILVYSIVLAASALAPSVLGFASVLYTTVALVTGASFILLAWRLLIAADGAPMRRTARQLFQYSLSYLFIVFFALLTDTVWMRMGGTF
ncbi:heme o synthase [Devosia nitrariae]|uniref:Protoheme IX farnesyltransferase n=1 Tax=Devosia nitrariae TaxID=2071872 RepID=A0ABQ5VYP4_9HYPH|nr:protoheme IX farnesyltransferase [Devosia nitrariae]